MCGPGMEIELMIEMEEKEKIMDILKRYGDNKANLCSKSLREQLTEEIFKVVRD